MADDETEQLFQRSYDGIYRSPNSPQQNNNQTVRIDGAIAIALAMLAIGGLIIGSITVSAMVNARVEAEIAKAIGPLQAELAQQEEVVWRVERESRIHEEQIQRIETGLGKKGININTDGH